MSLFGSGSRTLEARELNSSEPWNLGKIQLHRLLCLGIKDFLRLAPRD